MEAKQRYILPRSCPLGNDWIFLLPAQSQSPQEHRYKCCWKPVNPLRRSMWWDISCSSCLWHQTHTQAHSQACPFRTEEPGNGGWWRWNISWPEQEIKSWIRLVRTDSDSHLVRRWGGLPHGCSSCRARMELCDNKNAALKRYTWHLGSPQLSEVVKIMSRGLKHVFAKEVFQIFTVIGSKMLISSDYILKIKLKADTL